MAARPARDAVTRLLVDWGHGDEQARDQLVPAVYDQLRRLAGAYMRRERVGHTLQPTALVHEAYLRLVDQRQVDWKNRAQFVGLAAVMMRRILVNHARDRAAAKRGGDAQKVSLSLAVGALKSPEVDLIALHDALDQLAAIDARKSQIVELKFFGGLTIEEIAGAVGCSDATVEREWSFARAWLYDALAPAVDGGGWP
jgi:RNA polymerase sigma factor (TIGR02999 family)